jgi:aryl-alcohol dehydrogenase-like predicted oxidoreductase
VTELVLGTAQLGDGYGVTNRVGRLDDAAVRRLLDTAAAAGIGLFDTAPAYGDAEGRLGALMPPHHPAAFITKIALPDGRLDVARLVRGSLGRLAVASLHGVLLHRVADLDDGRRDDLLAQLRDVRDEGLTARIGVSVYDADELEHSLDAFPDLDLVQLPASIVDRRLLDHPSVAELSRRGCEVHVRSVFMQGLLLERPERLPPRFASLAPVLRSMDAAAAAQGIDRLTLVLSGVRGAGITGALVGATSAAELREVADAWTTEMSVTWEPVPVDAILLDPRNWD